MSNDYNKMMREAQKSLQKMQQETTRMQTELSQTVIEGSSGGGAVVITCNGNGEFKSIKIKKEAVDPEDVETLEDLVLTAVKDAAQKSQALMQQKAGLMMQGMNLPPGLF